ncbi:MAG TPA: alpha/beta hydrolase [Candidatus Dormibacteraeota bacterium]|jgi:acetyl esterase/lipase|nr:alpha/beta hydrolase [Candidatus Dormibacteraeota bacterium]
MEIWPEGSHPEVTLTPYLQEGRSPAIVVLPGGGYRDLAPHEADPIASWLQGLGLAAFVLRYRIAPNRHPAPLDDVRLALRTVRERAGEWRVDPGRVGILGFSAGGHLAASAATLLPRDGGAEAAPDLAVLCYPVISFERYPHQGSVTNLLGEDPDPELLHRLSLETQVGGGTPPTFLWHTAADEGVAVEHSLLFAQALAAHRVPFGLHVYPDGRHGLGLAEGEEAAAWTGACAGWLRVLGWIA